MTAGFAPSSSPRSGYAPNVTYAAIVDAHGVVIAHGFPDAGRAAAAQDQDLLGPVIDRGAIVAARGGRTRTSTYEVRQPLLAGDEQFGSIRIGISTILIKEEFADRRSTPRSAPSSSPCCSRRSSPSCSAQWMLRPIHVIQSGLTRLGRGELDVTLDLPGEEFRDLGSSFEAVSAQLSAVRVQAAACRRPPTSSPSWRISRMPWRSSRRPAK